MKIAWAVINIIGVIVLLCVFYPAYAKECKDCPPAKPCGYTKPAKDGCNLCAGATWCINNKWYSEGIVLCTNLHCITPKEIPNPFTDGRDRVTEQPE